MGIQCILDGIKRQIKIIMQRKCLVDSSSIGRCWSAFSTPEKANVN